MLGMSWFQDKVVSTDFLPLYPHYQDLKYHLEKKKKSRRRLVNSSILW
jgi:hypothetical protein